MAADSATFPRLPAYSSNYGLSVANEALEMWEEVKRLDLVEHVAELEVLGYTIVPPKKVAQHAKPDFAVRLREAILDLAEKRHGVRPSLTDGGFTVSNKQANAFGYLLTYALFEDQVFQNAMCHPIGLALTDYLIGKNSIASNCIAGVKGPGSVELGLHSDNALVVSPFPPLAQVCNVTFALTDYDEENGGLCFVPGSHRYGRHPVGYEGMEQRVPVVCKAGSMIFWSGHTWHGAFARKSPGVRVNLILAMMRPHMRPQEPYRENVTQEILDANPPRFAKLMGKHLNYGWKEEGPQNEASSYLVGRHVYD